MLGRDFDSIENLTAGSGDDTFAFIASGSLSGTVAGGAGSDKIVGDDAGRYFGLFGPGSGNVDSLIGYFDGIESLRGGTGGDTLVVDAKVLSGGLISFDGGAGADTVDFSRRDNSQSISILGFGAVGGWNLSGGTSSESVPSAIVINGFSNVDRVLLAVGLGVAVQQQQAGL